MTGKQPLTGLRALVVEDEYFIADDLKRIPKRHGADVIKLSGSMEDAFQKIVKYTFDIALIDLNIHGEMIFSLADEVRLRNIPFAFISGYDRQSIPQRFADIPNWGKPYSAQEVVTGIKVLRTRPPAT